MDNSFEVFHKETLIYLGRIITLTFYKKDKVYLKDLDTILIDGDYLTVSDMATKNAEFVGYDADKKPVWWTHPNKTLGVSRINRILKGLLSSKGRMGKTMKVKIEICDSEGKFLRDITYNIFGTAFNTMVNNFKKAPQLSLKPFLTKIPPPKR
jgi:hypothetical protein